MSIVYQKSDFYNAAIAEIEQGNFPALKARLAVGDVTLTQQLGAMAQMCAMLSYQIGLAEVEPWIKARDNMVLADAAARGVLPYGKATIYAAHIRNNAVSGSLNITAGRRLLDNKGRVWVVQNGATVAAGQVATVQIQQYETRETVHTVDDYRSFYRVEIGLPENDEYLLDIAVKHSDGELFIQIEQFNNVAPQARVYHVIADEMMNLSVQFGLLDKAGYVPNSGEKITLITRYTHGDIKLDNATPLELEYTTPDEVHLTILSADLIQAGAKPPDIDELREITNYPSLYDENAVFLGEFGFLLQRHLSPFVFLSVWNELLEEDARGASVDNINTLFVSFIKDGINTAEAQTQIKRIIQAADNSYRVKFVNAVEKQIPINVSLILSPMHDDAAVKQKVILWLLNRYGRDSAWARKGGQRINWQNTVKGLRESIVELQDGVSDVSVTVSETGKRLPEMFRYVAQNSITIRSEKLL